MRLPSTPALAMHDTMATTRRTSVLDIGLHYVVGLRPSVRNAAGRCTGVISDASGITSPKSKSLLVERTLLFPYDARPSARSRVCETGAFYSGSDLQANLTDVLADDDVGQTRLEACCNDPNPDVASNAFPCPQLSTADSHLMLSNIAMRCACAAPQGLRSSMQSAVRHYRLVQAAI